MTDPNKRHSLNEYIEALQQEGLFTILNPFQEANAPDSEADGRSDSSMEGLPKTTQLQGSTTEVLGLTYDSRQVVPGTLFVCKGAAFKEGYLHAAIEAGAIAYVAEQPFGSASAPGLIVSDIRAAMPVLADLFYNSPQARLKLIGVTGTKGKTTTVTMLRSILDEWTRGEDLPPTGMLSTIEVFDGLSTETATLTTPESMELFRHLHNAVEAGLTHVIVESSSQALKYNRLDRLHFAESIFLNISRDHISANEHPDFDDYFASKLKIFAKSDHTVYSLDMDGQDRVQEAASGHRSTSFSLRDPKADWVVKEIVREKDCTRFTAVDQANETFTTELGLIGDFNVENALAAFIVSRSLGVPDKYINRALGAMKVEGRMETAVSNDGLIASVTDFAHNKISFEVVIESARELFPDYYSILVFGCVGGRSENRRADTVGVAVDMGIDHSIITEDDPGPEDPEKICREMDACFGASTQSREIVVDREAAIRRAFEVAAERAEQGQKSLILLLGRGNETTMARPGGRVAYPTDLDLGRAAMRAYDQRQNN